MEMFIWIWKLKFKRLHEIATTNHTTAAHRLSHKFERHLPRKPFSNGKMCLHVINIKRNELLIDKQSSVHDTHRHGEIVCLCAYANRSKLNEPIQFFFFWNVWFFDFKVNTTGIMMRFHFGWLDWKLRGNLSIFEMRVEKSVDERITSFGRIF